MAGRSVAPTKTNLMSMRQELQFAELGHELLDQKRNILINELLSLVDQAAEFEARVRDALAEAFESLQSAVLRMGKRSVSSVARAVKIDAEIKLTQRRVMGVRLPVVDTTFEEHAPYFSPVGTSFWIDSSLSFFKEVLKLLGKLSELKISVLRLANEVKKTIRKVNALEKIAIPDLKETVHYIESRLEENERDMFVLMKMVKENLEKRKAQSHGG